MNLKKFNLLTSLFALITSASIYAQGTIRGSVIDDMTGEPLIGANVIIDGTSTGAVADLDGNFNITDVNPGTYTIKASFVSYQTQNIQNVIVKDGEVTVLNVRLKTEDVGLDEVIVTAEAIRNNEAALLTIQRRSSNVLDGISAQQFSRIGDSDAASAVKRITGVSVEGGKYIYVRGLGDRYSKTTLNSAEIPGLDPNRNTVQMDLFPTNLIDNIIVYKTFSPDIPGSFAGGYVNVSTKDFPTQFTLQVSGSVGYNAQSTFNDEVLTHDLGDSHWLGFASSDRDLPEIVADGVTQISFTDSEDANMLDRETKAFNTDFNSKQYSPFLNHAASISIGDQKEVFGKQFGFIGGLTYNRSYSYYGNGKVGRYLLPGNVSEEHLDTIYHFNVDKAGSESVLWGALLNTSVKLNNQNKVSINLMRNQSSETETRYLEGVFPYASGGDPNYQIQNRSLEYLERSLTTGQLKGEHGIGNSNPIAVDWIISYTQSTQDEPDLRYFNNLRFANPQEDGSIHYTYNATSNNVAPASRYYREMEENNIDGKINVEIPLNIHDKNSKIKIGASYIDKERTFDETIIQYRPQNNHERFSGDVNEYFEESNLGIVGQSNGIYQYGLTIRNETTGGGSYTGSETIPAAYAMIDWQANDDLKISTGARYEGTDVQIENKSLADSLRIGGTKGNDILPALNITYQLRDDMNLRFGYGRTLARPTFRELARYQSFDFQGDFILIGNPNLERTLINNIDLRWEMFPRSGELLSFSLFYKDFKNPIERVIDPNTNDLALQVVFRNVGQAKLYGAEVEFRKNLESLGGLFTNFNLGTNFSYIYSRVDIQEGELKIIRVNDPDADDTRVMFGQSPYIANAYLNYENLDRRLSATLSFNVQGEQLVVVSTGGTPNIFQQPRPQLGFNLRKGISERFSFKVAADNILDSEYAFTQEHKGREYTYQSYTLGRSFSVGLTYLIE